jgi:hypothetical protein
VWQWLTGLGPDHVLQAADVPAVQAEVSSALSAAITILNLLYGETRKTGKELDRLRLIDYSEIAYRCAGDLVLEISRALTSAKYGRDWKHASSYSV